MTADAFSTKAICRVCVGAGIDAPGGVLQRCRAPGCSPRREPQPDDDVFFERAGVVGVGTCIGVDSGKSCTVLVGPRPFERVHLVPAEIVGCRPCPRRLF